MKSEITLGARCVAALVICVAMSSCGDDPELVRKRDEQRAEIAKLNGQLELLQEKMEQIPPDRGAKIEELKLQAEENRTQIAALEAEIEGLQKQKADVEKQHQAYRRKYVAK
jgi:septal ring factor EnvC (AmiA/AmiB activator)